MLHLTSLPAARFWEAAYPSFGGILFMTLTEFEALAAQDSNDCRYELDEGELITLSPSARPHAKRIDRIYRFLIQQLREEEYDILPGELGFVLSVEPKPTVRGADLAVMFREDDPAPGFVREAPLLVVEVVSPGNNPEDMEKKRLQYLEAGAREIWIVYDKTKTIHVFQNPDERSFVCNQREDFLSTLGFTVKGQEIFR